MTHRVGKSRKGGREARVLFLVSPPVWPRGSKAIPNTHAYGTHTLTRAHTPQVPSHMLFGMKNCPGSPCFISVINCEREREREREREVGLYMASIMILFSF